MINGEVERDTLLLTFLTSKLSQIEEKKEITII